MKKIMVILIVIFFLIAFFLYSNNEKEKKIKEEMKIQYSKYLYQLGFSKTENPSNEEINNYKKYIKLINDAVIEKKKENYFKAEELYLESTKYHSRGYEKLGETYLEDMENFSMSKFKKAEEYFKLAYEKGVRSSTYQLAEINRKIGNMDEANFWYQKGLELGDVDCQIYIAKKLYLNNEIEKAEKILKEALENVENFQNANLIYNLLIIHYEKGNIEEVKKLSKRLRENGIEELNEDMLIKIKYIDGNEKKEKIFKYLIEADKLMEKGEYPKAEKKYLEAIKYDEKIKYYLAKVYEKYGREDEVINLYEEASEVGENRSYFDLADMYVKKGEIAKAKKYLEKGDKKGEADCQYALGVIFELAKNNKKAFKYYLKSAKKGNFQSIAKISGYLSNKKKYKLEKKWIYKIFKENEIFNLNKTSKLILLNRLMELK